MVYYRFYFSVYIVPSIDDGDNAGSILCNVLEDRLREIEVGLVAPPAWRAEVGGGDDDGAREAPLWVADALELEAGTTAQAIVK